MSEQPVVKLFLDRNVAISNPTRNRGSFVAKVPCAKTIARTENHTYRTQAPHLEKQRSSFQAHGLRARNRQGSRGPRAL